MTDKQREAHEKLIQDISQALGKRIRDPDTASYRPIIDDVLSLIAESLSDVTEEMAEAGNRVSVKRGTLRKTYIKRIVSAALSASAIFPGDQK